MLKNIITELLVLGFLILKLGGFVDWSWGWLLALVALGLSIEGSLDRRTSDEG